MGSIYYWLLYLALLLVSPILRAELISANNIVGLQKNLKKSSIQHGTATKSGQINLYDLNQDISVWYLIETINNQKKAETTILHIENPWPEEQTITLDPTYELGIIITSAKKKSRERCRLWQQHDPTRLIKAFRKPFPYVSICNGRLFLRNRTKGLYTQKEWVAEFLRDNVWGGDSLTAIVKKTLYKDKYLLTPSEASGLLAQESQRDSGSLGPPAAKLAKEFQSSLVPQGDLGLTLKHSEPGGLLAYGKWYGIKDEPFMFTSVVQPKIVATEILKSYKKRVNKLDYIERDALVYLVAFDLDAFELRYSLGTDHPKVEWSGRTPRGLYDRRLGGPDGFETTQPLVQTGIVNPILGHRLAATFTAGFKRFHGGFRYGRLAHHNKSSHYGFVENGVVFSTLQPNLATMAIDKTGKFLLKTWRKTDDILAMNIQFARQNGVPILYWDSGKKRGLPHRFVGNWGKGNWSGSAKGQKRSVRAGVCTARSKGHKYLIYGYFSSTTPSAMARVFQAYGCDYAMHMDMNALEHTYLARYIQQESSSNGRPEQLVQGMEAMDRIYKGNVPRFVGYADNRDFFYVLRKSKDKMAAVRRLHRKKFRHMAATQEPAQPPMSLSNLSTELSLELNNALVLANIFKDDMLSSLDVSTDTIGSDAQQAWREVRLLRWQLRRSLLGLGGFGQGEKQRPMIAH